MGKNLEIGEKNKTGTIAVYSVGAPIAASITQSSFHEPGFLVLLMKPGRARRTPMTTGKND